MSSVTVYLVRGRGRFDRCVTSSAPKAVRAALIYAKRGLDAASVREPLVRRLRATGTLDIEGVLLESIVVDRLGDRAL